MVMENLEQLREKMVYLEQQLAVLRQERLLNQLLVEGLDAVLASNYQPQALDGLVGLLCRGLAPSDGLIFVITDEGMDLRYPAGLAATYPPLPNERLLNVFNVQLLPGWHAHFAPQWPRWRSALLLPLQNRNQRFLILLGREVIGGFDKRQEALLQTFSTFVATVQAHLAALLLQAAHRHQPAPIAEFSHLAAGLLHDLRGLSRVLDDPSRIIGDRSER